MLNKELLTQKLKEHGINFPKYFDQVELVKFLTDTDEAWVSKLWGLEPRIFKKYMDKMMPNKHHDISYAEYLASIIKDDRPVLRVVPNDDEDNSFEAHKAAHYARHAKNKIVPEEEYEGNN